MPPLAGKISEASTNPFENHSILQIQDLQHNYKTGPADRERLSRKYATVIPSTLRERRYFPNYPLNKLFACAWVDNENVLVGSKDNGLLNINLTTGTFTDIPRPPPPPHPFESLDPVWGNCGIHSISINPCRDLVATGGINTSDCVILHADSYKPVHTLVGHRDWLFGSAWVTDRHIVTGSRDQSMALWKVTPEEVDENTHPNGTVQMYDYNNKGEMKRKFGGKVRGVQYNEDMDRVVSLSTLGAVRLHDHRSDLRIVRTLQFARHTEGIVELTCMAVKHDLIAAGDSHDTIYLGDPRQSQLKSFFGILFSPNSYKGVRSISFKDNILTYGNGYGKVAFVDTRTWRNLPLKTRIDEDLETTPMYTQSEVEVRRSERIQRNNGNFARRRRDNDYDYDDNDEEEEEEKELLINGKGAQLPSQHNIFNSQMHPSPNSIEAPLHLVSKRLQAFDAANYALVTDKKLMKIYWSDEHKRVFYPRDYIALSDGTVIKDETYWRYLSDVVDIGVPACYCHEWSPCGTRLFCAGGGLSFGAKGSYIGLWA